MAYRKWSQSEWTMYKTAIRNGMSRVMAARSVNSYAGERGYSPRKRSGGVRRFFDRFIYD